MVEHRQGNNSETQASNGPYYVVINLQVHLASFKVVPRHAKIDVWIGQNARFVAFRRRYELVKPFQVFHICCLRHEEHFI